MHADLKEKGVRLVESDGRGVVLEYRPVFLEPNKIMIDGIEYYQYRLEGGRETDATVPGTPSIPAFSSTLRLPSTSHNTVEVLNAEYEDVPGVMIAPVSDWREGEIDPEPVYRPDPVLYSSPEFLPPDPAALLNVGATQGEILGELRLFPLQYLAGQRTLRKYSRIVVRVTFGTPDRMNAQRSTLTRGIALNDEHVGSGATGLRQSNLHNSVLASGTWFRFSVTEDGIYRFSGQTLISAGIPQSVDPSTIKVYGNGGFETPLSVTAPAVDDLVENAVYVNDRGTVGGLDAADDIVFYGKGTRGWQYNPASRSFGHYINRLADGNFYWLTYGNGPAKQMTRVPSVSDPVQYQPQTVVGKIFREDDKVNLISSGLEWLGQPFNVNDQITYVHSLGGLDVSQPISYKFRVGARSSGFSTFSISEHGQPLTTAGMTGTDYDTYSDKLSSVTVTRLQVPTFSDGRSQLRFSFTSTSSTSNGYIDWYEILYRQFLIAQNNQINFHTDDTTVVARYSVSGFSDSRVLVFDVTRYDSVVVITARVISGDTCSFQLQLAAGGVKEIYAVAEDGLRTPSPLERMPNQNLHGDTTQAAFIIITHPDFRSAAQRLKNYREQPGENFLKTIVVDINQIYNEFGGGLFSPAAIRNYLRYVNDNWETPAKYVLLFGDGHYDYKNISTSTPNWVPPWETPQSVKPLLSYAVDDDYVIFNSGNRVGMGLGRLAARSTAEANILVDKIIEYESNPVVDPWKVRLTYVADDGPEAPGRNNLFIHTDDAESISQIAPPLFEKKKIYLYAYPAVFTPAGRRKPDVNVAIVDQINQGTIVLNFNGHGNPRVWTHEQVFVRETDFANLSNKGKYFFLIAATCNYSHFDMVNDQSGGEMLVGMPNAGAIAIFSATRPVFQSENFEINSALDTKLLQVGPAGNVVPQRLGDVVYFVKQSYNNDNDRKYFLLGDPTLRPAFPGKFASIDSLNHVSTSQVGQLRALSTASVRASVHDSTIIDQSAFSGTSQLVVFDASRTVQFEDSIESNGVFFRASRSYAISGNILFRGEQSVTNGSMAASFIVPKDISYGNDFGRMTMYFWNASTDGAGYSTNFRIGGTDTTAPPDVRGPEIKLYIDNRGFRSGDVVSASPTLIAELFDSSGINTSGAGIGHRLEAWVDDRAQSQDLSNNYKSKTDTYQEGTVQYALGPLSSGTHRLRLRAWDTYNNSSTEETVFDVLTGAGLQLSNVFNFPNPVQSSTVFTFEHNQLTSIDAEVKIFTVAGRLIQSLKKTEIAGSFVQIPWDGRDREGDLPANGVYLYKIIAKTLDDRFTSEALGKLSILR
ncbi:MAG TPA: type IX secretion system sortase PorU [Bacteroidota bacterium]|nr:type IX secretion system sortase PorU [Bacteroidota bacterium]